MSPCLVVWHGYRRQEACGCFIERFLRGVPFLFGLIGTTTGAPSRCCFRAKPDWLRRCNFRPNACGCAVVSYSKLIRYTPTRSAARLMQMTSARVRVQYSHSTTKTNLATALVSLLEEVQEPYLLLLIRRCHEQSLWSFLGWGGMNEENCGAPTAALQFRRRL